MCRGFYGWNGREGMVRIHIYCDMTSESRNSLLLGNGSLTHVSTATDNLVEINIRFAIRP
jgi:hypothetical protein